MNNLITVKTVKENLENLNHRINIASARVGRDVKDIKLVVVTKGRPVEVAEIAILAGAKVLGENYPEEGAEKRRILSNYVDIEWHMIGHIQSKKSKEVCAHYNCVHSLDSVKLGLKLNSNTLEMGIVLPVLLECNISGEDSKFGFPAWNDDMWNQFINIVDELRGLKALKIIGLMTMAPFSSNPEDARPFFQKLAKLKNFLQDQYPDLSFNDLSMGMSGDFEVAIEEGATFVRVGTAIFGPRSGK